MVTLDPVRTSRGQYIVLAYNSPSGQSLGVGNLTTTCAASLVFWTFLSPRSPLLRRRVQKPVRRRFGPPFDLVGCVVGVFGRFPFHGGIRVSMLTLVKP
jgi:hypothetical protein